MRKTVVEDERAFERNLLKHIVQNMSSFRYKLCAANAALLCQLPGFDSKGYRKEKLTRVTRHV